MVFKKGELIGDKNPAKRLEVRKKISEKMKGRIIKEEWKENMKKNHWANKKNYIPQKHPNYGNHIYNGTEESKKLVSIKMKKWWAIKNKDKKIEINLKPKTTRIKPSIKPLDCNYCNNPCKSGKRRNPDFINRTTKEVLLFNGRHWHNEIEDKIQLEDYNKKGFKVLVINEDNIINQDLLIKQIWRWIKSESLT